MEYFISSEVLSAYTHCQLKAFHLLFSEKKGVPSEYITILDKQTQRQKKQFIEKIQLDIMMTVNAAALIGKPIF